MYAMVYCWYPLSKSLDFAKFKNRFDDLIYIWRCESNVQQLFMCYSMTFAHDNITEARKVHKT